jgi:hypothetical protein
VQRIFLRCAKESDECYRSWIDRRGFLSVRVYDPSSHTMAASAAIPCRLTRIQKIPRYGSTSCVASTYNPSSSSRMRIRLTFVNIDSLPALGNLGNHEARRPWKTCHELPLLFNVASFTRHIFGLRLKLWIRKA